MNQIEFLILIPSFLKAFSLNLLIAVCAMLVGSLCGFYLANLHHSSRGIKYLAKSIILMFRNIPSFVLLFYLALIIPTQFSIANIHFEISPIAKAIFALAAPVAGFACGYFLEFKAHKKPFLLAPWNQYFIVILMASTTASVIGVKELMSTANAKIAISGDSQMVIPIYSLVALWFISCSLILSTIIKRLDKVINKRSQCKEQVANPHLDQEGK